MRLPGVLILMDGYGLAPDGAGNAVALARTPNLDELFATYPWAPIACSGLSVGLPEGQMGNSEVGHLNIGAGRVVYQEFTRISKAIDTGELFENPVLRDSLDAAIAEDRSVHFMGLVSDGGVHSHISHLFALLRMACERGARRVFVHAFLDGRDVPPTSGADYLEQTEAFLGELGAGRIASVMGRYWAMDRDKRWERIARAWRALVLGEGQRADSAAEAVRRSYGNGVTDEFVEPVVVGDERDVSESRLSDGDAVVFFNFRPDRAREITRALVDPDLHAFARPVLPKLRYVCLTEYDPTIQAPVAFPKDLPESVLADVLAGAGLRQLHIAETEKYAHVTFFLNGGSEPPKEGEERILIPSPKAATYDLQPEMSEPEVTRRLVEAIRAMRADVYIVNYANCDMVGHTGDLEAAIAAVEAVDDGVGKVVGAVREMGGVALVTGDHGNAECMRAVDGSPYTAHTTDVVPLIAVADDVREVREGGILADISPTLLDLIGCCGPQPAEWTGRSLLVR